MCLFETSNIFTQIFTNLSIPQGHILTLAIRPNTFDESIKAAQALYDIQRINLLNPEINVRPGDVHHTDLAKCHSAWKELETLIATFMGSMSVTEQDLTDWQIKAVPLAEEFMEFFSTEEILNCKKKLEDQTKLMKSILCESDKVSPFLQPRFASSLFHDHTFSLSVGRMGFLFFCAFVASFLDLEGACLI